MEQLDFPHPLVDHHFPHETLQPDMGGSINGGTTKSSMLIGLS
jgi:hypothetical protein